MRLQALLAGCLVFSGLSALVYQVLWTRLLGFALGTTTEAIGTVLAVFFGGMAIGNLLAARWQSHSRRPLRVYGLLELGIGLYALLTLPLLGRLDLVYAVVGTDLSPVALLLLRAGVAALILLPPTIAMGATLPVVARGLVAEDGSLGRWSAYLYSANTLGAVAGAYLCGFWMIPLLGLTRTVLLAAGVNLAVALAVIVRAGEVRAPIWPLETERAPQASEETGSLGRGWFLFFFGVSGYVAIGYEIVWSKVFTIVMEGTLYGFSTVLSAYLLGLALGSLAIARRVDSIRDLARAFGLLHIGIAASVALGLALVADLPHWHHQLAARFSGSGGIHGLYILVAPVILLPTMLFGAAFPILIRIYTCRAARVGEGMGIATAINTAGSIAASLSIGFWLIPAAGIDQVLFGLILLEVCVAMMVLVRFQTSEGPSRLASTAASGVIVLAITLSYGGVEIERAVTGRWIEASNLEAYRTQLDQYTRANRLVVEGRTSVVTVNDSPGGLKLMTNGMPESGFSFTPPHRGLAALLLGMMPYLVADTPERALIIGFGGGATLDALRRTPAQRIEVVELEKRVVDAARLLYQGRENPLADPRVSLAFNDGRNHLLLGRHRLETGRDGRGYDLIASQPSHPWLAGAANLFTEEYFQLARANLVHGGAFALWVNGFHAEPESLLALFTSFERVFPGGLLVGAGNKHPRGSYILLARKGGEPIRLRQMEKRFEDTPVREAFELHEIGSVSELLARVEGPLSAFAAIRPRASNTDDNAFVEMRLSRHLDWGHMLYSQIEVQLARDAPVYPPFAEGEPDVAAMAEAMIEGERRSASDSNAPKLRRLLEVHGRSLDDVDRATLSLRMALVRRGASEAERDDALARVRALVEAHPDRPEPMRALADHLARERRAYAEAGELFARAHVLSHDAADAYDAARALHWVAPARAFELAEAIDHADREAFPRLDYFEAHRAWLEHTSGPGLAEAALRRSMERLRRYRDTDEGRRLPGVNVLLARYAEALGDPTSARAYRDADAAQRARDATPLLERAEKALGEGDLRTAESALERARTFTPIAPRLLQLETRLAAARGDPHRLGDALLALRRWSPSLKDGVTTENTTRAALQLPLLPPRPAHLLDASASRSGLRPGEAEQPRAIIADGPDSSTAGASSH